MQPEYLIAGPEPFVLRNPTVESGDFGRPCVTSLEPTDGLCAKAEPLGDVFLQFAAGDCDQDLAVPGVTLIHLALKAGHDSQSFISSRSLNLQVWANHGQKRSDIVGVRDLKAEQPLVSETLATTVLNYSANFQPLMHGIESWAEGVGDPDPQPPAALVDFDASLAVHETCEVADEDFFGPCVHARNIAKYRAIDNSDSMAVPVLRWLLTRIETHAVAMEQAA